MKKTSITILILVFTVAFSYSQTKKDLLQEVDELKGQLRTAETALSEIRQQERINSTKVESYEMQVAELQANNNDLMKSLNAFTEASAKRSENISNTLVSLQEKEKQLRTINDALSARDSVTLAIYTLFKQHLGPDAKITVNNGTISVVMDNEFLFGNDPAKAVITTGADALINKVGALLNARQELDVEVVGNSNLVDSKDKKSNNWSIATAQAAAVANSLEQKHQIAPQRIRATGKSELGLYSIETSTEITIQPKFDQFYKLVKESMK